MSREERGPESSLNPITALNDPLNPDIVIAEILIEDYGFPIDVSPEVSIKREGTLPYARISSEDPYAIRIISRTLARPLPQEVKKAFGGQYSPTFEGREGLGERTRAHLRAFFLQNSAKRYREEAARYTADKQLHERLERLATRAEREAGELLGEFGLAPVTAEDIRQLLRPEVEVELLRK